MTAAVANTDDALTMWTIYDHPRDYPAYFVARCFHVTAGAATATNSVVCSESIESLRSVMRRMGKTCLARDPDDDLRIVETWL